MPRAAPPRLSSFGRVHKRSSSVGIGFSSQLGTFAERTRSLERKLSQGLQTSRPSLSTQMEEEGTKMVQEQQEMNQKEGEEQGGGAQGSGRKMAKSDEGKEEEGKAEKSTNGR